MPDEKNGLSDGYEICAPIARDGDAATLTATYTAGNGIKLRIDENADADGNDEDGAPFDPGIGEFLPTNEQAIWLAGKLLAWAMHDHGHKPANPRMTAGRLAALLLEHPDAEVILEDAGEAAVSSAESGEQIFDHHQRAAGLEVGYGARCEADQGFDLSFTIAPHVPASDGVPTVRIMGHASDPTSPTRVRRRVGPGEYETRDWASADA